MNHPSRLVSPELQQSPSIGATRPTTVDAHIGIGTLHDYKQELKPLQARSGATVSRFSPNPAMSNQVGETYMLEEPMHHTEAGNIVQQGTGNIEQGVGSAQGGQGGPIIAPPTLKL